MIAGQPPLGCGPSGSTSPQASVAPSEADERELLRRRRERRAAQHERSEDDAKQHGPASHDGRQGIPFYDHRLDARPIGVFDSGVGG